MNFFPEGGKKNKIPNYIMGENLNDENNHTPEKSIEGVLKRGGIVAKTYYETGFHQDKNLPLPSLENLKRLTAAAHKNNLPVLIHANSYEAYKVATKVGVDGFAHGLWRWPVKNTNQKIPNSILIVSPMVKTKRHQISLMHNMAACLYTSYPI